MSSAEVSAPVISEPTAAPATQAESTPTVEAAAPAAELASDASAAPADQPATNVPEAAVAAPAAAESAPVDQPQAAEDAKVEEKKEKKQGRKPFADLLNKILKPNPQERYSTEKKGETEAAPAVEAAAPEAAAPAIETPAAEPEVPAVAPEAAAAVDAPAEAATAEDNTKDVSTPRKERGNILDKITAFVMKPKSPKGKKSDAPKDDVEVPTNTEADAADVAAPDTQVAESATPATPPAPVADAIEAPVVEAAAHAEAPEEAKVEKKEKTPKDLAKMARRFSGRLFGGEKKKDASKKPDPTQEEIQAAAQAADPVETPAVSDAAPQIPADTTPEVTQAAAEPAPVIAATA